MIHETITRKQALALMEVAGYHADRSMFTRLLIENRISRANANLAFRRGADKRAAGWPCACIDCKANRQ